MKFQKFDQKTTPLSLEPVLLNNTAERDNTEKVRSDWLKIVSEGGVVTSADKWATEALQADLVKNDL